MKEEKEVRRFNLWTDLWTDLTMTAAVDELEANGIARCIAVVMLCEDRTVETATHCYRMLP